MEHPSNTNLKYDLEKIIIDIFNGIKPSLNFDEFLELISTESDYSICWKPLLIDSNNSLYLFSNEWNMQNKLENPQYYITKYFNNLVLDSNYNVIMYTGPKVFDSNRDKISLADVQKFSLTTYSDIQPDEKLNIYKSYEGTSVNVFYYTDRWYFSTKKKFDMFESKFGSNKSHGQMFEDILKIDTLIEYLDIKYTYHFVIVHNENTHLSTINNNRLILLSIRDKTEDLNTEIILDSDIFSINDSKSIVKSPHVSILYSDFLKLENVNNLIDDDENTSQGYIIHINNYVFRLYTESYGKELSKNPKFNSVQESLIWNFKNNKLVDENNNKIKTIAAINYVSILLHRLLIHFTKFNKFFNDEELRSHPNYKFLPVNKQDFHLLNGHNALIRNISRLQRLPYTIRNISDVNFGNVKYFVKQFCTHQDIYGMYLTFINNPNLSNLVKYKKLNDANSLNIYEFNNI